MGVKTRIKSAWNAFNNPDGNSMAEYVYRDVGGYGYREDKYRMLPGSEKSIVNTIYNRMAVDAASVKIEHVRTDDNGQYSSTINSGLNYALTQEANLDQTGRELMLDAILSMIDTGSVAIVPVDTTGKDPMLSDSWDVETLRVANIITWQPETVRLSLYNQKVGHKQEIVLPKKMVALAENPFYNIMNAQNSTLQRLIRKLNLLDAIDTQSGSGKLDIIVQLPYTIKSEQREAAAEKRKLRLEQQMQDSKYGIGYIDAAEKITQLNRPADNQLLDQVEYLTTQLYTQLGITTDILQGTASEAVMKNYYQRITLPLVKALTEAMSRKFLSKTSRSQNQSIMYFGDTFSLVPAADLANIADKFIRNQILSANEFRGIIGFKPSDDPKADQLQNPNIAQPSTGIQNDSGSEDGYYYNYEDSNDDTQGGNVDDGQA